ncbi:MAG: hypothetical protein ACI8X5_003898 [Planctomycetota bacterium]|jgi:hypothetical protein
MGEKCPWQPRLAFPARLAQLQAHHRHTIAQNSTNAKEFLLFLHILRCRVARSRLLNWRALGESGQRQAALILFELYQPGAYLACDSRRIE